jgi:mRNA interferase YafQ
MKNIKYSTQAKKDLKRFLLFPDKLKKLYSILKLLQEERPLPEEVKKHVLQGNLFGLLECHIENDFLLIWKDLDDIYIVRIGSHSELFNK